MKVNSTGLGKTTLVANFGVLEPTGGSTPSLKMTIESTQPIHWHITVALDGSDIRQFIGIVLKPKLLIHVLKMLLSRTPTAPAATETKPATAVAPKSTSAATQTAANPKS
jgi:hypothetical protein